MFMNKFRVIALALMLPISALVMSASKKSTGPQANAGATSTVATANYTKTISPSQVNNTGRYVIKNSGYYFLTEDLHFYPKNFKDNTVPVGAGDTAAAIYIEADNVVLDLNNKSITMNNSKKPVDFLATAGVDAIVVKENVQNVVIKNGTISYSTGFGIHVLPGTNDGDTSGVTISNMNIMNCPLGGVLIGNGVLDGSGKLIFDVNIDNVSVSKCQGTIAYGTAGGSYTGSGHARGIILDKVAQAQVSNTSCSNNHINSDETNSQSDAASQATGLYLHSCQNVEVTNCAFNRNNAYLSYGLRIASSNNVHVMNSKMLNNFLRKKTGVAATAAAIAVGAAVETSDFCRFDQCEASKNSLAGEALTKYGVGFYVDGTGGSSNNNVFNDCVAAGNAGGAAENTDVISGAIGAGFLSIGASVSDLNTGNQYLNCRSKGNTCTAGDAVGETSALGIGLLYSDSATVQQCLCIANGQLDAANTRGVGLLMGPQGVAETTGTDSGGTGNTAAYTRNAVVRNNWFVANTWHGVYDMAADSQSLFMENYAFRNGLLNAVYAEGNIGVNQLNFKVDYEQSNENLPMSSGTVGGFGAFNVAGRYVNNEIQVTSDSLTPGDTGYPFVPAEDTP